MPESRSNPVKSVASKANRRQLPARGPPSDANDFSIVAIGASAGGLDACIKFLTALPSESRMAFILVQHLDPTHESMMVDLLAGHTSMPVQQATDGMAIERDHLYIIPPGSYLSVGQGVLHLSAPQERHGARLPFDFLLHSLAEDCGSRAICVILSGTGADGCLGLKSVKENGGLIIAQDPGEAGYDGMPRSAIMTGAVDLVLPVAKIPEALAKHQAARAAGPPRVLEQKNRAHEWLHGIIELLRTKTAHDFTLYKPGTLQRRIERRMALASIGTGDVDRYLEILRNDPSELDLLAKDLLINVTSFFRDPQVFDFLAEKIVPDLVRSQPPDHTIRIWVAGCSTGEEAYSMVMLFREQIAQAQLNVKLQVFASDVDPDAVVHARDGLYPATIKSDVSPERLARYFSKEEGGYRVSPELRDAVVFTVQDLLSDPPFSRLDLVSCRNLLIYLSPEAQAKVISIFHFALRNSGLLMLGSAETIGSFADRFEVISKPERIYRHVGRSHPGEFGVSMAAGDGARGPSRKGPDQSASRPTALADLCRRLVLETYAPAAVLIDRKHECLYSLGPTDRYLHMASGHATHDLLAMVPGGLRSKLKSAIQQSSKDNARRLVAGGQLQRDGEVISFNAVVLPVPNDDLLLICFVDEPKPVQKGCHHVTPGDLSRVSELEHELEASQAELQGAVRDLELLGQEQKVINEEALSINEEYQSTNEELLTSKEELQSLNEELTALNSQLHETLERQRTTSDDLQNVLYSTNMATLFLDTSLKIRFFTPATKALFSVIPGDVGRPLADLKSLSADTALADDVRAVLKSLLPIEREIETLDDVWFIRRILPYLTHDNRVEGVVITYTDITERRQIAHALEAAKQQADLANIAKSRFLAVASHDLRQPLQTLALLQGLLATMVRGEKAQMTVARIGVTLSAMTDMLNTLLDINRIEAGTVRPEMAIFPINELLGRLRDEFAYNAKAQGIGFHVVPCGLAIRSDPRLLEQMIRNLISNALKYTEHGGVLLGCRRSNGRLSIEIWDTGIGIPVEELQSIFDEYHQLDNGARERGRGLGLGLSIVKRLGTLLAHRVRVRSQLGRGSVFTIEVDLPPSEATQTLVQDRRGQDDESTGGKSPTGTILIVEDDPDVRELLEIALKNEGHHTVTALDGVAALGLVDEEAMRPDIMLADFNLPNKLNGLQLAEKMREKLRRDLPVIILTGDISTDTLRNVVLKNCIQLNKPVKLPELTGAIKRLLPISPMPAKLRAPNPETPATAAASPVIFVVDDDKEVRDEIRSLLEEDGWVVETFDCSETFLEVNRLGIDACLLIDACLPGMSGLELLQRLQDSDQLLPAIMITGHSDVAMAVDAMKAGALDFIEKPVSRGELLECVERALERSRNSNKLAAWHQSAADRIAVLTRREREVMELVLAGHPSKNIAADLGISQRTVENHRASIMKKTGSKSLPALARLALAAARLGDGMLVA